MDFGILAPDFQVEKSQSRTLTSATLAIGRQVEPHAIGDGGIVEILDLCEAPWFIVDFASFACAVSTSEGINLNQRRFVFATKSIAAHLTEST